MKKNISKGINKLLEQIKLSLAINEYTAASAAAGLRYSCDDRRQRVLRGEEVYLLDNTNVTCQCKCNNNNTCVT